MAHTAKSDIFYLLIQNLIVCSVFKWYRQSNQTASCPLGHWACISQMSVFYPVLLYYICLDSPWWTVGMLAEPCFCVCVTVLSFLLQMFLAAIEHSAQHCASRWCVCLCEWYKAMLLTYLYLSSTSLLPVRTRSERTQRCTHKVKVATLNTWL